MIEVVSLTEKELELCRQICFSSISDKPSDIELRQSIEPAYELAKSLLERKAIPLIRIQYFKDPEFNINGRGKSRKNIFEQNGTKGESILRHPHFHPFLRYFIFGPDLPSNIIEEFNLLVNECEPVTSGDFEKFCNLARQQIRNFSIDKDTAAEEYFKLCLELGLGNGMSRTVRDNIMKMEKI